MSMASALHLGGLFVSMSGNSTRMGVLLVQGQWLSAVEALGLTCSCSALAPAA
jgi:uncharacterized membrane protein YoaK (UPF0700 family)